MLPLQLVCTNKNTRVLLNRHRDRTSVLMAYAYNDVPFFSYGSYSRDAKVQGGPER